MDDLISRQQATDALEEQLDYLQMLNKEDNPTAESNWYGVNWARNTIADLPSVQQWIPVKKNGVFPKEGETVLITNDKGHVKYGQYRGIDFWTDYGCYWWWKKNTSEVVRAWMPKPEPFREDEEMI